MRRWFIASEAVLLVLIGLVGVFILLPTTRFDDRAYPGSSWSKTPDEVFSEFDIDLPECSAGHMRYWAGSIDLYLKITAPPDCISRVVEVNRLSSSEPLSGVPVSVTTDKRAVKLGWHLPRQVYTRHTRLEGNTEIKAYTDATERSLHLIAWHQ